jgi:hypothetical protein
MPEKWLRPRRGGGGDGMGGDPCGRPRTCRWKDEGRPRGMSSPPETEPHSTSQPLPPLRERGTFSPKNLPVGALAVALSILIITLAPTTILVGPVPRQAMIKVVI